MNDQEIGVVLTYVLGNWPNMPMAPESDDQPSPTLQVYRLELADLAFDETIDALREDFAADAFPPPPMKLRDLVLRRRRTTVTYEAAQGELLDAIGSLGYTAPEPEWSSPVIGELVGQRGGWAEVCRSTPARAAVDAAGISAFSTWSAQFRDHYRIVAARVDRTETRRALHPATVAELAP